MTVDLRHAADEIELARGIKRSQLRQHFLASLMATYDRQEGQAC